jgi:hypothetical protein
LALHPVQIQVSDSAVDAETTLPIPLRSGRFEPVAKLQNVPQRKQQTTVERHQQPERVGRTPPKEHRNVDRQNDSFHRDFDFFQGQNLAPD